MKGELEFLSGPHVYGVSARFSEDRLYRYELLRAWGWGEGVCNFVMLNPSTADETKNDPTVERCERYARRWGYGVLAVTNLFAFRATNPKDLRAARDARCGVGGPENDAAILRWAHAELVVVAWGNHGGERARYVLSILTEARPDKVPLCLGVNRSGHPVHPLYQPNDAKLVPFPGLDGS
jgi:hypothetical protein